MTHGKRIGSESGFYHVVTVGLGHQVIFEDDDDRLNFYRLIERVSDEENIEVYAWCFMGNHVHLVVKCELANLARFMLRVESIYVRGFNEKHGRCGALFQRPYWSDPILTDERMMTTVRYVHRNPLKARLVCTCADYRWSSYNEYTRKAGDCLVRSDFMFEMLGGHRAFEAFHEKCDEQEKYLDIDNTRIRRTNEQALALAHELIGAESLSNIAALPRFERDKQLHFLKESGLTLRQIAWLTGIGKSIVERA